MPNEMLFSNCNVMPNEMLFSNYNVMPNETEKGHTDKQLFTRRNPEN
jgi:hypothetical protein